MTFKLNSDKTAAVSLEAFWKKVGPDTPRGVNMWLINRSANVSLKGMYDPSNEFYTHWFPNPKFPEDETPC